MVLIIVAALLIAGIAFFQILQGLFSALIMTILTILCAALAFALYEPAASLLYTRQPAFADAVALMAIFILPLLGLRILFDKFLGGNVVVGLWADRIGGGVLGLITGMIMVGVLAVGIQMLPLDASVMTYKPFDDSLQRQRGLAPFYCDEFTLGLMKTLSAGSLKATRKLSESHDNLLLETFCARNTAGKLGRVDTGPDALLGVGVYPGPERRLALWLEDVPDNPLLEPGEITKVLIVRCDIDQSACDPSDATDRTSRWRLPATHFRLVSAAGLSYYPVAYMTYGPGGWKAHPPPIEDQKAQIAKLIVVRPYRGDRPLTVDWVYRIPKGEEASYVTFRRVARKDAPVKSRTPNEMPSPRLTLDRQPPGQERRRRGRR